MAQPRNYVVPLTGVVTVDAEKGTVEIEVDLVDLAHDLKHDYEYEYDDQTKRDGEVIRELQSGSLEHHYLKHTMGK